MTPTVSLIPVAGGYRARVAFPSSFAHGRRPVVGPVHPTPAAAVAAALALAAPVIAAILTA